MNLFPFSGQQVSEKKKLNSISQQIFTSFSFSLLPFQINSYILYYLTKFTVGLATSSLSLIMSLHTNFFILGTM